MQCLITKAFSVGGGERESINLFKTTGGNKDRSKQCGKEGQTVYGEKGVRGF